MHCTLAAPIAKQTLLPSLVTPRPLPIPKSLSIGIKHNIGCGPCALPTVWEKSCMLRLLPHLHTVADVWIQGKKREKKETQRKKKAIRRRGRGCGREKLPVHFDGICSPKTQFYLIFCFFTLFENPTCGRAKDINLSISFHISRDEDNLQQDREPRPHSQPEYVPPTPALLL